MKRLVLGLVIATLAALGASYFVQRTPDDAIAPVSTWSVSTDFGKSADARLNISGAACAPAVGAERYCIAVNDEKKYAQFFTLGDGTLRPDAVIRLLGDSDDGDPDAEGAAYAPGPTPGQGYFYITGSHGLSRKNEFRQSRFLVFRISVDAVSGRPLVPPREEETAGVDVSPHLRAALQKSQRIGAFAEKPLRNGGLNIEGLAARSGQLYFGLRAPSIGGDGFIVSVDAEALFRGPVEPVLHALKLGTETGIRDLAAVSAGLLVLSGPTRDDRTPYSIHLWTEAGGLTKLGDLDLRGLSGSALAESLLVLDEDDRRYRVLVLFDGLPNGGPREFHIQKR